MLRSDFAFELPSELIAQHPPGERGDSRLLGLDRATGALRDGWFRDLAVLLNPGDLLVLNDTRVIPARLFGRKQSGGRVEVLIERLLPDNHALAHVRASRSPRVGQPLQLGGDLTATVVARNGELFELVFDDDQPLVDLLQRHGHVPIPPYIDRPDTDLDRDRYQTVYARHDGAVAAPTAGLHFDRAMLERLAALGIERCFVTLHVGAGTFQPVRSERLEQHEMHSEQAVVSAECCRHVARARERGGRVVAVGTTVVRSLEAAAQGGDLVPLNGDTDIFIFPGYAFRCVDALITNFHLPESTLLMLVAAFAGYDNVMNAYRHAVAHDYRFFSYGDAMFIG